MVKWEKYNRNEVDTEQTVRTGEMEDAVYAAGGKKRWERRY